MKDVVIRVRGRVQGVGFRRWAVAKAKEIGGISGWVHNDHDGTVLLRLKGNEDSIDKIFNPFFTTKIGQGGQGLGLYIVYNLVHERLNGTIQCNSSLGKGTTFTITFPNGISQNQRKDSNN